MVHVVDRSSEDGAGWCMTCSLAKRRQRPGLSRQWCCTAVCDTLKSLGVSHYN